MTANHGGDGAPERVELHDETVTDLDTAGDPAGGLRRAGGFTDLDCTDYLLCDTSDCSELCEP